MCLQPTNSENNQWLTSNSKCHALLDAATVFAKQIPAECHALGFLPCDFLLGCCRHQLIAEFFRPSSQAFDVLLPVSLFEGLLFLHRRTAVPTSGGGKSR